MKPKGQTWLIPSALYVEDYISGDDARRHRTEHMKGKTIHDAQIERENDCIDTAKVRGQAKWDELPDQEKTRRIIKALR